MSLSRPLLLLRGYVMLAAGRDSLPSPGPAAEPTQSAPVVGAAVRQPRHLFGRAPVGPAESSRTGAQRDCASNAWTRRRRRRWPRQDSGRLEAAASVAAAARKRLGSAKSKVSRVEPERISHSAGKLCALRARRAKRTWPERAKTKRAGRAFSA